MGAQFEEERYLDSCLRKEIAKAILYESDWPISKIRVELYYLAIR